MGYMTNVTILNDQFDWVEKNPKKFVKAIKHGMTSGTDEELWYPNRPDHRSDEERTAGHHGVTVHKAEHADIAQIIYSRANATYPVHELAYGGRTGNWVKRWGARSDNAKVRVRILRGVVDDLRDHADRLQAELDAIEKEF